MKSPALALVLFLLTAGACKSESSPSTTAATAEGASSTEVAPSTGKGRSGKIDLPNRRRPTLPGAIEGAPAEGDRPDRRDRKDWDPAKREEMKEKFDEMRKEREAKIDTDGDGKISEAERVQARHDRADKMRTRMDANNDGKVSAEELAGDANGRFARRLGDPAALDTNKDGDISTAEIDAAMAARGDRRGPRVRRDYDGSGSAAPE